MRTTNVNPKRGYGLLIFLLALLLKTNTLSAQDSCSTYQYNFPHPGLRVFSDTTLWQNWHRSVEFELNDFPEEGYFHVQVYVNYNSENRQRNESLYILVENSRIRYPQNPNISSETDSAAYLIVTDDPTAHFDEFKVREAGIFYFEKGYNVVQINHYKKIVEQFPQFVHYYPNYDSLTPGVNSGRLLGGFSSGESVECFIIALVPVNCGEDLQLQTTTQFSSECIDSTGQLQTEFQITEIGQLQFSTGQIDSLVFKIASDTTVNFFVESPGWESRFENEEHPIWTFVWRPELDDAVVGEVAQTLQLKVEMDEFDAPIEAQASSQLFLRQDTNPDNQYTKSTVHMQLDCDTPTIDLSIQKNGVWQSFLSGDRIDFQIVVKNEGTTPANNFFIRDSIDARLIPMNFSLIPQFVGKTMAWQITTLLDPGQSYNLSYTAELLDTLQVSQSLALPNYVFVETNGDNNPGNNSDSTRHVYRAVDLSLLHDANVDTFCLADTIGYNYSVKNNSPHTAYRIQLEAQVPRALRILPAPNWALTDSTTDYYTLTMPIDSIGGMGSISSELFGVVHDSLSTTLQSEAAISIRNDSLTANNAAQVVLTAGSCIPDESPTHFSDFTVIKNVSRDTVKSGDNLTYTLSTVNIGPHSSGEFYLLERMPSEITVLKIESTENISTSGDTIRWPGYSLAAGDTLRLNITAQFSAMAGNQFQTLTNYAEIVSPHDTLAGNNIDSADVVIRPADEKPKAYSDLTISKNASRDTVISGEILTYAINLTNLGPDTSRGFYVLERMPSEIIVQKIESTESISTSGDTIRWPGYSLASGDTLRLNITAQFSAMAGNQFQTLTNYAEIVSPHDTLAGNNIDSADVVIRPADEKPKAYSDLTISKNASRDTVISGEILTYAINLTNLGPDTSRGFYLLERMPSEITVKNIESSQNISTSGDTIRWPGYSLASGDTLRLNITAQFSAMAGNQFQTLTNYAEIVSPHDTLAGNNIDSADVVIRPADEKPKAYSDLRISKNASRDTVTSGEILNYSINLTNLGPDTSSGFYILEHMPAGLTIETIESDQQNIAVSDDTIRWTGLSLAAGESAQVQLATRVDALGGSQFETLTNLVSVFSGLDSTASNNRDSATVILRPVPTEADLSLGKRAITPVLTTGELAEFELVVTNNGPGYSDAFFIVDSLSSFLSFYDFGSAPETHSNRVARWSVSESMAPGQTIRVNYTALVGENIPQLPDTVYNYAFLSTQGPDNNPLNNRATASIYITCNPDCYLDRNVFAPAVDGELGIHFQACNTERVPVKIYDMLGTYITTVVDEVFSAGVPQTVYWDGFTNSGQRVGSGAYIIVIGVAPKPCKLKFLLVQ